MDENAPNPDDNEDLLKQFLESLLGQSGADEAAAALQAQGFDLSGELGPLGWHAGVADVLDAAAVAWTAMRVATGRAHSLPDPPEVFSDGWPAAIWV